MQKRYHHRRRVLTRRNDILRCLADGMSIADMARHLGLDDIPRAALYRNVALVRSNAETGEMQVQEKPGPASTTESSDTGEQPDKAPAPKANPDKKAPKKHRKKRKFVAVTVGGNLDDDLNPAKWREKREAREEEDRLAKENEKDTE